MTRDSNRNDWVNKERKNVYAEREFYRQRRPNINQIKLLPWVEAEDGDVIREVSFAVVKVVWRVPRSLVEDFTVPDVEASSVLEVDEIVA